MLFLCFSMGGSWKYETLIGRSRSASFLSDNYFLMQVKVTTALFIRLLKHVEFLHKYFECCSWALNKGSSVLKMFGRILTCTNFLNLYKFKLYYIMLPFIPFHAMFLHVGGYKFILPLLTQTKTSICKWTQSKFSCPFLTVSHSWNGSHFIIYLQSLVH